nr:alpha/beta hydrolase-fold protein [Kofleriaceae bacterium]
MPRDVSRASRGIRLVIVAGVAIGNAAGCHFADDEHPSAPDAGQPAAGDAGSADACPAGLAGAPCVLALYDRAAACTDAPALAELHAELDARAALGPLWAAGRALFRTPAPLSIAGDWNAWSPSALPAAPLCGDPTLDVGVGAVPTGFHMYKLSTADGATWTLDAQNPAFAYDDFTGNPDHLNSVLDTPDSGRGHLVDLGSQCSTTLGNCRDVTAYLPPGYDAPDAAARTYPVMFMHDGQNVWDNHTCCFGHTGWEINVTLDSEIAAGKVEPIIVVAADNTTARNDEYGLTTSVMDTFMDFQVHQLQPAELAVVRGDGARVVIAGSSLGGLVSMQLALRYPDVYSGVASLSGAFWPGLDDSPPDGLLQQLPALGKQPVAIYVDSGGATADDSDGAQDTVDVRDELVALGWQAATSPDCTRGESAVCYHLEPGATHDELAWQARAWRFLEFLFPAPAT